MIKVLIVEDSLTAQVLLRQILSSDGAIQVLGTARNGLEALEFMRNHHPDVITMDLHMPVMDGLEATRTIMETKPVPIIIVSNDWDSANKADAFDYLEAGAVAALEKPQAIGDSSYDELRKDLIQTVKIMSEIKVVRRFPARKRKRERSSAELQELKIVVIGASTGGPPVLKTILSSLSENFPVPILIVQHIAHGFLSGLGDWLDASCALPVAIARQGQAALPGHVYLAPDEFEMGVSRSLRIHLSPQKTTIGPCPSVAFLFRSALVHFGPQALGVLLSGMGKDGAEELALMKNKGSVTIAQNEESCVVFGMPGAAVKLQGATHILPPEKIGPLIERTVLSRL
ncbi:MAG: chemotaxis-specific protein-glutamate methyltransferase CheB [Candidatus Obscuribacterales bacterium]|nr:chemotaxis-specific protein-glutamate methyltransferase CheB [Candidatus Obscuribacterales bacterium]